MKELETMLFKKIGS